MHAHCGLHVSVLVITFDSLVAGSTTGINSNIGGENICQWEKGNIARYSGSPDKSTNYQFRAITTSGCIQTNEASITVTELTGNYIPNAFTTNEDGVNDVFRIFHPTAVELVSFQVFDRWGGTGSADGIYTYVATFRTVTTGSTFLQSGTIQILR